MAAARLARFEIRPAGQDFTLHIENESGATFELLATHDQLDVLADALDDVLMSDEAGDEVKA